MNKTIKLMTGTNVDNGYKLVRRKFPDFSSWSNNLETIAHYYEGCVIEIEIDLTDEPMDYISELADFNYLKIKPESYTYGCVEVKYPEGVTWYSFSQQYLKHHVVSVKEIFPNLSKFDEL